MYLFYLCWYQWLLVLILSSSYSVWIFVYSFKYYLCKTFCVFMLARPKKPAFST